MCLEETSVVVTAVTSCINTVMMKTGLGVDVSYVYRKGCCVGLGGFWLFVCLVFFFPNTSLLVSYFIHVLTDFTLLSRNQEL